MATTTLAQQTAIANLYVALYNRAPDATGFEFWSQALGNGAPLPSVAGSLLTSPESLAIYAPAQSATDFVSTFYRTVFGREADASGLAFWTSELEAAGGMDSNAAKAQLVLKIVEVVSTPLPIKPADLTDAQYAETVNDREIFRKKAMMGIDFAVNLKSDDLNLAKQLFAGVTAADAPVAPSFPTTPDPVPTDPTPTAPRPVDLTKHFTLTTGHDTFVGGPANDTFTAPVFDRVNSINTHDNLDGGDGVDTLNASLFFVWREIPTLNNIEVVNLTTLNTGVMLDIRLSAGFTHVGFTGGDDLSDGTIFNVGDAVLSVANQNSRAAFTGSTATSLSLNLSEVGRAGSLSTVDLAGEESGARATTHNIDANNAYVALAETVTSAAVTSVHVTASGANALTLSAADAGTVQALTVIGAGSVDFSGRALSALKTFTGGSGDITLSIAALSSDATIDLGAGNDKITLARGSAEGATIDGGAGDDIITTGAVTHTVAEIAAVNEVQTLRILSPVGPADATRDTVSVTILGETIVTAPIDLSDTSAVVNAIKSAVDDHGNLVARGLRVDAGSDTLTFTFGGDYAGIDQADLGYDGNADGNLAALSAARSEPVRGSAGTPGVVGSVDTLAGGTGADTFVFATADVSSKAGAVTAVITDFQTGVDKISVGGSVGAEHFARAVAPVNSLAELLTAADAMLDGLVQVYVGEVGGDAYLVSDLDGVGYTNVIQLSNVALTGIVAADLIEAPVS